MQLIRWFAIRCVKPAVYTFIIFVLTYVAMYSIFGREDADRWMAALHVIFKFLPFALVVAFAAIRFREGVALLRNNDSGELLDLHEADNDYENRMNKSYPLWKATCLALGILAPIIIVIAVVFGQSR